MEISKQQRKKIAYIITLPDLGGAQSHVYELLAGIWKYGYEPILITGKNGWLTERADELGITCHIVPDLVRQISPWQDWHAAKTIIQILKEERPQVVHCHSSKAGILGRLAAHKCQIPAIFTAHGWAFTDGVSSIKRRIYAAVEKIAANWTDKIICVSEYDEKLGLKYLRSYTHKMTVIHNCIPDMPDSVKDWHVYPGKKLRVVIVARFAKPKKNLEILQQIRNFIAKGENISLTFIGDGPDLPAVQNAAVEWKLEEWVTFLGKRTDVAQMLPKYDVFLLLSRWEGFPISILEAMRAGLPVLASNVGGVKEAVEHGETGYLLEKDSDIEIYLKDLQKDSRKLEQMGNAGRKKYLENFTIASMLEKTTEIYEKVAEKRPCCPI